MGVAPTEPVYTINDGSYENPFTFTHETFIWSVDMNGEWICGDVAYQAKLEGTLIYTNSMQPISYDQNLR